MTYGTHYRRLTRWGAAICVVLVVGYLIWEAV